MTHHTVFVRLIGVDSIPDDMKLSYTRSALKEYLKRDLEAMFDEVVSSNGNTIPRMDNHIVETCMARKICPGRVEPSQT